VNCSSLYHRAKSVTVINPIALLSNQSRIVSVHRAILFPFDLIYPLAVYNIASLMRREVPHLISQKCIILFIHGSSPFIITQCHFRVLRLTDTAQCAYRTVLSVYTFGFLISCCNLVTGRCVGSLMDLIGTDNPRSSGTRAEAAGSAATKNSGSRNYIG
jgi:hypothetical protein